MITAANAVYVITIPGVFGTGQQLQGFSADDVVDTENIQPTEEQMGVDGFFTAGFVHVPKLQGITLLADSASGFIFETWHEAMIAALEAIPASATIRLPSMGRVYTCTRGFLRGFVSHPGARRVLQPRRFQISWQRISGAPL